jgi:ABC-type antimicrobial peptide transport system permease subunit
MFMAFGGLAIVLAGIGLYAVIGYNVTQRTQELGVRIALGATVGDLLRLVMGQGIRFAVLGVIVGGAIALASGKWLGPLLFAQSPRDPAVFLIVAGVLVVVAVVASAVPAVRAGRVDPNTALRAD